MDHSFSMLPGVVPREYRVGILYDDDIPSSGPGIDYEKPFNPDDKRTAPPYGDLEEGEKIGVRKFADVRNLLTLLVLECGSGTLPPIAMRYFCINFKVIDPDRSFHSTAFASFSFYPMAEDAFLFVEPRMPKVTGRRFQVVGMSEIGLPDYLSATQRISNCPRITETMGRYPLLSSPRRFRVYYTTSTPNGIVHHELKTMYNGYPLDGDMQSLLIKMNLHPAGENLQITGISEISTDETPEDGATATSPPCFCVYYNMIASGRSVHRALLMQSTHWPNINEMKSFLENRNPPPTEKTFQITCISEISLRDLQSVKDRVDTDDNEVCTKHCTRTDEKHCC